MAENILGGGYLPPAKPFNVINPSGVSSESALDTLLAVGEGKRNRAHQARQSAAAMEFQQREAERERMFQTQQTQASQQFAEQQRRKNLESEEYFRTREERFALMLRDQEDAIAALNEEARLASSEGFESRTLDFNVKRGELRREMSQIEAKMNKLQILKAAQQEMFGVDFTDANGKSVGAAMLRNLSSLGVKKAEHFKGLRDNLRGAVDRLKAGEGAKAAAYAQQVVDAEQGRRDETAKKVSDFNAAQPPSPTGKMLSTKEFQDLSQKSGDSWAFPPQAEKEGSSGVDVQGLVQKAGGRWKDLSQAVGYSVAGDYDPQQTKVRVEVLLNTLEQAVNATPQESDYYLQQAAEQYKSLAEEPIDRDALDKAFFAISMMTATAASAKDAIEGQKVVNTKGSENEAVGQVGGAYDLTLLSKMVDKLSQLTHTYEDGTRGSLLKGFRHSEFFDFEKGEVKNAFADNIMEVFTVMSGAEDPVALVKLLTDGDKENDPQNLKFINRLHPEVRDVILKDLSRGARQIEDLRQREGLDTAGRVNDLPGLQGQLDTLLEDYRVHTPNETARRMTEENKQVRSKMSQGREGVRKRRTGDREKLDQEMESARRKALDG